MFPSPGRAAMALGLGAQQLSSTAAAGTSSTPTVTFAFQPAPPTSDHSHHHHHHGVLGYGSSHVLDRPTTATSSSSSHAAAPSSTVPSSNLHHLQAAAAAHVSLPTRSSPPHPWSSDERGKGATLTPGGGGLQHGAAVAALGVGAVRMKKAGGGKARRKMREPRFCFKTMSDVDVLDDGYKWRKYGQKVVKNTQHPRSYYRCTQDNCRVKKRVERLAEDPRMVITTYEGRHVHSPSHDDDDAAARANAEMTFLW